MTMTTTLKLARVSPLVVITITLGTATAVLGTVAAFGFIALVTVGVL